MPMKWNVSDKEIEEIESILFKDNYHFSDDAKQVIRCWDSTEVSACPGSGKTTVLLAKLKLLADRMPLENGSGICVLSHTNVAVNEVQERLTEYTDCLMSYPNFIGTIQTFIDRFVTFPYLKMYTNKQIEVVDNYTCAHNFWNYVSKHTNEYSTFFYLVKSKYTNENNHISDLDDYVAGIYQKQGNLFHGKQCLARNTTNSAIQFIKAKREFLKEEGMITYNETYDYAMEALRNNTSLRDLLSRRFQYVFVDEYQDCREVQRQLICDIFDPSICMLIRIGDPDQAIYDSDTDEAAEWKPSPNALSITTANRYSQNIADVLTPLRATKEKITSTIGSTDISPILIVFNQDNIVEVLPTFSHLLEKYHIDQGKIKAIGWVSKSNNLKIADYWEGYPLKINKQKDDSYWVVIDEIVHALNDKKLYKVEYALRRLIVKILSYIDCEDSDGKKYSMVTVKKRLDSNYFDQFRGGIISLCSDPPFTSKNVEIKIRQIINSIITYNAGDVFSRLPDFFMESINLNACSETNHYVDEYGRTIEFGTIHSVKGETHGATLYLETVFKNQSDISRVLPLYQGKKQGNSSIYEKNRKLVYVGLSRPRKLLCLAVTENTYQKGKVYFEKSGWEVIDLRQ